jgi:CSLREA domain-containing protein
MTLPENQFLLDKFPNIIHNSASMKPSIRIILLFFLVLSGSYSLGSHASWAFNFTVNSPEDAEDANPGDTSCANNTGFCTLRAAIQEANSFPEQHTITLPAGTYLLTKGELLIVKNITINGAGQGLTIVDGNHSSRVFSSDGGNLILNNLTVQNGADSLGGGIYNPAELLLQNVTLTNNSGPTGSSYGGGIYNSGVLTIKNGVISHNQAANGGGLFNDGTATLEDVTVDTNAAGSGSAVGGGIYNFGTLFLRKTTVNGSGADIGAGIFNAGVMDLTNVTLSANSATSSGGGIYNGTGGGAPEATLTNVTISGNTAPSGAGIFNANGNTIDFNNTIVAGNSGGNCAGAITSGAVTSNGHNLDSGNTCGLTAPTDFINTNPLLGLLNDNGGPTFTQTLGNALAKNVGAGCPPTDQRGYPRPSACDLGAYEDTPDNPYPMITTLAPNTAQPGGSGFPLTVNGYNFLAGSIIYWKGSPKTTTFVNSRVLRAAILQADLAAAGTALVTVTNPAPGGGPSNEVAFTISSDNPSPSITALIPETRGAGWPSFSLTVNGSNFLPSLSGETLSVVLWNGFARPTAVVSDSQLRVTIPKIDLAAIGTASITVSNSPPGGGFSLPATFTIGPPFLYLPILFRN